MPHISAKPPLGDLFRSPTSYIGSWRIAARKDVDARPSSSKARAGHRRLTFGLENQRQHQSIGFSQLTIQGMPNWSVSMPKRTAQNVSEIGIVTVPISETVWAVRLDRKSK